MSAHPEASTAWVLSLRQGTIGFRIAGPVRAPRRNSLPRFRLTTTSKRAGFTDHGKIRQGVWRDVLHHTSFRCNDTRHAASRSVSTRQTQHNYSIIKTDSQALQINAFTDAERMKSPVAWSIHAADVCKTKLAQRVQRIIQVPRQVVSSYTDLAFFSAVVRMPVIVLVVTAHRRPARCRCVSVIFLHHAVTAGKPNIKLRRIDRGIAAHNRDTNGITFGDPYPDHLPPPGGARDKPTRMAMCIAGSPPIAISRRDSNDKPKVEQVIGDGRRRRVGG